MNNRHAKALSLSTDNIDVAAACELLSSAQRELSDAGKGTNDVRADPAVRLIATRIGAAFDVPGIEKSVTLYSDLTKECEAGKAQGDRLFRDGLDSQNASNPSGLALSIARHARDYQHAETPLEKHPGLRLIAYQVSYLCNVLDPSPQDTQQLVETCRAQSALAQVEESKPAAPAAKPV